MPTIPLSALPKPQPDQRLPLSRTQISRPTSNTADNTPVPSRGRAHRPCDLVGGGSGWSGPRPGFNRDAEPDRLQCRTGQGRGGVPVPDREAVASSPRPPRAYGELAKNEASPRACGNPSTRSVCLRRNGKSSRVFRAKARRSACPSISAPGPVRGATACPVANTAPIWFKPAHE